MRKSTAAARIGFGAICRGQGKIYILLKTAALRGCTFESRSVVRGRDEVPSRIVELESGEYVLILAVLRTTQTVTITARSADGSTVCRVVKNVGRRMARLNSQVRTLLKDPGVSVIRNCDTRTREHDIEFFAQQLIMGAPDEPDLLHVCVCYVLEEGEDAGVPLDIRAFHADGRSYASNECSVLGDFVRPHHRVPTVSCRYVSFSLQVPREEHVLSVLVRAVGAHQREGFKSFESFVVDAMRGDWINRTRSNENCPGYEDWFLAHRPSSIELELQRASQRACGVQPLFSVIVPLYHTPLEFFQEMAASVLSQTYGNFELILVNSTPQDEELRTAVERLCARDSRVRVVTLDDNLGITENTNAGIDVARGDFVSFFDHDDLLEPDLLYWYAKEIEQDERVDLLYCDEDKYEGGHYTYPFFKPDWSPLFLETNNYVCHLLTVRRELLNRLPRATKEFDGAQDHRLALLAGAQARKVAHVRRILYHWRIHEQSTAANANAKPESFEAGRRAIELSLSQRGIPAHAHNIVGMPHCYHIEYDDVANRAISVVVVDDGTDAELSTCLEALDEYVRTSCLDVVVAQRPQSWTQIATSINEAVVQTRGEFVLMLSSRVVPTDKDWARGMLSFAARPDVGVVGGRVDFADGTKARGSIILHQGGWNYAERLLSHGSAGSRGFERLAHESLAVSGSCLMVRRSVLEQVGGISEGANDFAWFVDLCLKVRELGLAVLERPGGMFETRKHAMDVGVGDAHEHQRLLEGDAWLRTNWPLTFAAPDPYYSWWLGGNGYYDLVNDDRSPALPRGEERVDRRSYVGFAVHADHMILDGAYDIVRGEVICTGASRRKLQSDVQLKVEEEDGTLITDRWVCMGDTTHALSHAVGYERTMSFAVRVPANVAAFRVVATRAEGTVCSCDAFLSEKKVACMREARRLGTMPPDQDPRYDEWFRMVHRATQSDLAAQRVSCEGFAIKPVFSFVVPLYKTPLDYLAEMANSVLAQSYPHLELVLVNASPEDVALERAVQGLCLKDARVREVRLEQNFGITENTNEGIRHSTGGFIAFLDHDDVLEPDLLYWYVKGINDYPHTDLLYCDEDHLIDGRYTLPFFKTDWDLDRLRTENYVCHLLAVRKSLVDALPALPGSEMDGSQDHNMTLLIGEQARNVYHVRRVLYHWRAHENSTAGAQGTAQKSYALEAERIAVQNHLDRCEEKATALMGARRETRVDVVHEFAKQPLVSIVIPSHDMAPVLERCVDSIRSLTTWNNYEVVVVENASREEETFALYERLQKEDARVRVITCVPKDGFNFSELINVGFKAARGEYLLMLNNDTEVLTPDWIEQMMGVCQRDGVGCVGAKLLYPDDTIQHVGVFVGRHVGPVHANAGLSADDAGYYEVNVLPHRMSAVTGACLLTKRQVWSQVGGLDETLPVDYNDVDYCLKVAGLGLTIVVQTNAVLRHYESVSRGSAKTGVAAIGFSKSFGIFNTRWSSKVHALSDDPYYNPNFLFDSTFYRLNA